MVIRLYHGSQNEMVEPQYGRGLDYHDFGRGFYLTEEPELAKEWSVYRPKSTDGWIHAYDLDMTGLRVLDYRDRGVFAWIAELMKHHAAYENRDAAARQRMRDLIADPGFNRLERLFSDVVRGIEP